MDELVRYTKKCMLRAFLMLMRLLPVKKNRILLINDLAYNYSDNPKYIAEHLQRKFPGKFELVVSVKNPENWSNLLDRGMKVVRFNSLQYFKCAMTSAVLVSNSGGYSYIPLRKSQYVVNTWHGGGAYKKCGTDMFSDSIWFCKDLMLQAKQTNVFLSTCKRFTEVISNCMLVPKNVFWEIGMPRNDMLIHQDTEKRLKIRQKIGLKDDEKIVLFAPTYRKVDDNYFKDSIAISYGIDASRVCEALTKRFGGKWRFAIRYHPCVVNRGDEDFVGDLDLTDYEDMQELLLAADAMINDFSSSMWDFMLTGRPSFMFAIDLDHYVSTTDVYTPVEEWPFPKAKNNDELIKNILEFDETAYAEACRQHYTALGGCETGQATELVCNRIYEVCFGKQLDVERETNT